MSELMKMLKDIGKDYTKKRLDIDVFDEPYLMQELIESIKSSDNIDINVKDKMGNNLLHIAAIQYFSTLDLFDILITKGVSINEQNKKGETVLHLLLDHDNYFFDQSKRSIFNLLIEKGADVYVENKLGWTPLDHLINEFPDRG